MEQTRNKFWIFYQVLTARRGKSESWSRVVKDWRYQNLKPLRQDQIRFVLHTPPTRAPTRTPIYHEQDLGCPEGPFTAGLTLRPPQPFTAHPPPAGIAKEPPFHIQALPSTGLVFFVFFSLPHKNFLMEHFRLKAELHQKTNQCSPYAHICLMSERQSRSFLRERPSEYRYSLSSPFSITK